MKILEFNKNGIFLAFCIDSDGKISVGHIGSTKKPIQPRTFAPTEIFITGENPIGHLGAQHVGYCLNNLKYEYHTENDHELLLVMSNHQVRVTQHYEFYDHIKALRSYAHVTNISSEDLGLEYVSSFCLYDFDIEKLRLCHNAWCRELEWRSYTPQELGYHHINAFSTKRITISNTGTWSTKEFLPMGIAENTDECIFWQIEHDGSWNFEISDVQDVNYLMLSGPSEQENGWWKNLKSNESFETVKAAICFADDFNGAIEEMTAYRRKIAYRSPKDKGLPVIFNDYMNCLNADPITEKELPLIDAAANIGAEIYCMDAGWYADGEWWSSAGEWTVCESRFPNGMKEVFDYIKEKGMKPGIWLEPEIIGIHCPILDRFSDDCFFMRHGKRVIDRGRYQLDFRNKKVTDFLNDIVDGLIRNYGIEYFKFDYNIDSGVGTEVNSDSFGDGLMQHKAAYMQWIDDLYRRHPGLIIENCSSGGMRMDYQMLSHCSMQSTSDASDYRTTAAISAMSGTAVLPEQAQVWVLPMQSDSTEEIALNMVNAMFRRPVISGETHLLNPQQFKVLKESVDFYKSIRQEIPSLTPFYPLGAVHFEDEWAVYGFHGTGHDYLCAESFAGAEAIEVPLNMPYKEAICIDIIGNQTPVTLKQNNLHITLKPKSAVMIKLIR